MVLVLLSIVQILASTAAGAAITVVSPSLVAITGSDAMAGWGQTSTIIGAACLSLPVARLAARFGRPVSLASAFGVAAAGALIVAGGAITRSLAPCLVGLAAVGAGTVAALALRYAAADAARSSRQRARSVGMVLAGATVGSLLGPNIVGWVGTARSPVPYLLIAVLYAGAACLSLSCRLPQAHGRDVSTEGSPMGRSGRRAAVVPTLIMVAGHAAMIALMGMAPVHLMGAVPASVIGWVMSAHLVAMYAASPLFGALVRRVGSGRSGLLALLTAIVACSLLAIGAGGVFVVGAGLVFLGLAWSLGMVACSVALSEVPAAGRLRVQGRGDLALNTAAGVTSLLAGVVVAAVGYEGLAILVGVGLCSVMVGVAGVLVASVIARRRTQSAPEEHTLEQRFAGELRSEQSP
ncbi:MAG: MFS transporter [Leifsonia sp.]